MRRPHPAKRDRDGTFCRSRRYVDEMEAATARACDVVGTYRGALDPPPGSWTRTTEGIVILWRAMPTGRGVVVGVVEPEGELEGLGKARQWSSSSHCDRSSAAGPRWRGTSSSARGGRGGARLPIHMGPHGRESLHLKYDIDVVAVAVAWALLS